jgi:hypothetical protein
MWKKTALLLLIVAACDSSMEAETRNRGEQFPLRSNWSANVSPVGSATVSATLAIKEYLGSRMETMASITGGAVNGTYQWRIFRGDCATTAVAASNTAPTGLLLFATIQSYPDIPSSAAGTGTTTRVIAGALDSLTAYSARIRLATSSTNWNGTNPLACGNLQRSQN